MMLVSHRIPLPISCISRPMLLGCYLFRQIPSNFSPLGKMDRSEKSTKILLAESLSIDGNSAIHKNSVMAERSLLITSSRDRDFIMVGSIPIFLKKRHMKYSQSLSGRCSSSTENNPGCMSTPNHVTSSLNPAGSEHAGFNRRTRVDLGSKKASVNTCCESSFSSHTESNSSSCTDRLPAMNFTENIDGSCLPDQFGRKRKVAFPSSSSFVPTGHKIDSLVSLPKFDICWRVRGNSASLGKSLPAGNKEHCTQLPEGGTKQMILRPGMVLLKHYLNHNEQVKIVKNCRELGLGPGGFYQPGYKDGAKLRLHMMCLGLDWDPQTRKYGNIRQIDGTKVPNIPGQFSLLVKRAIQDAHSLIKKESEVSNVEEMLPSMSPNICIVNF